MPEPQFSYHNARNQAEIFLIFFLTFFLSIQLSLTLTINVIFLITETERNFKREKKQKFTQFCNFQRILGEISEKLQLRHLRLEILSTFPYDFCVFEAHFVILIFLIKKRLVCNQHYRNIHDPNKLVNAIKSSILLLLGLPTILETLLKNLRKGTQSSVKLQG